MEEHSILANARKKVKRFKKGKEGATAIEVIGGVLVFLIVFCALFDLMVMGWRFSVISQTSTHVARTVGLQGGLMSAAPAGFPGGSSQYVTIGEMRSSIENNFEAATIEPDEYTLKINNQNFGSNVKVDYRDDVNIELTVDYEWTLLSNWIPGTFSNNITSRRTAISEFKYRYDNWQGE